LLRVKLRVAGPFSRQRRRSSRAAAGASGKVDVERGAAASPLGRALLNRESVLRRWMRELTAAPAAAFLGNGQMRADLVEIAALKKEIARLRAERDILKRAAAS